MRLTVNQISYESIIKTVFNFSCTKIRIVYQNYYKMKVTPFWSTLYNTYNRWLNGFLCLNSPELFFYLLGLGLGLGSGLGIGLGLEQ